MNKLIFAISVFFFTLTYNAFSQTNIAPQAIFSTSSTCGSIASLIGRLNDGTQSSSCSSGLDMLTATFTNMEVIDKVTIYFDPVAGNTNIIKVPNGVNSKYVITAGLTKIDLLMNNFYGRTLLLDFTSATGISVREIEIYGSAISNIASQAAFSTSTTCGSVASQLGRLNDGNRSISCFDGLDLLTATFINNQIVSKVTIFYDAMPNSNQIVKLPNAGNVQVVIPAGTTQIDLPITAFYGKTLLLDFTLATGLAVREVELYTGVPPQWSVNSNNSLYNTWGNVLIGKSNQSASCVGYKLDVAGSVRADQIFVNTCGADFVFDKTYKLLSLPALESFIKENKHLPEIHSAFQMQSDGVSVGDIQTKLLQKVEELTLYIIEKDKEISALKDEKDTQKKLLVQMKDDIEKLKKIINQ